VIHHHSTGRAEPEGGSAWEMDLQLRKVLGLFTWIFFRCEGMRADNASPQSPFIIFGEAAELDAHIYSMHKVLAILVPIRHILKIALVINPAPAFIARHDRSSAGALEVPNADLLLSALISFIISLPTFFMV